MPFVNENDALPKPPSHYHRDALDDKLLRLWSDIERLEEQIKRLGHRLSEQNYRISNLERISVRESATTGRVTQLVVELAKLLKTTLESE